VTESRHKDIAHQLLYKSRHVRHSLITLINQLRFLAQTDSLQCQRILSNTPALHYYNNNNDYCNSVLAGLPWSTTEPLQRVLNAAARLVVGLKPFDSVTPALKQLHWLPIEHRIKYKLCLLMYLVHINKAPQYRTDIVTTVAQSSARPGLRSADTAAYAKLRTKTRFGERSFCYAGPVVWNSLPSRLHFITDTIVFKCKLKTELFKQAFDH